MLQIANEGLQKQVNDAAVYAEAERRISRNSTLEFERLVAIAQGDRDKALECQRKAEEGLACQGVTLKKTQDTRNTAMEKVETLSINLLKLRQEHRRQVDALEKAHRWIAATMSDLGLTPRPLEDPNIGDLISFFAHLVGQLAVLPYLFAVHAEHEGR